MGKSAAPVVESFQVSETVAGAVGAGREGGDFPVVIVAQGATRCGGRYYSLDALREAVADRVFEGKSCYWGHGDVRRVAGRGHREMGERVGVIREGSVTLDGEGRVVGVADVFASHALEALQDDVARPRTGVSYVGVVEARRRAIDGRETSVVQAIKAVESVDFVPEGNAGGRVSEGYREGGLEMDREELQAVVSEAVAAVVKPLEERLSAVEGAREEPPVVVGEAAVAGLKAELEGLRASLVARDKMDLVREALESCEDLCPAARGRVARRLQGEEIPLPKVAERVREAAVEEVAFLTEAMRQMGVGVTRVTGNGGGVRAGAGQSLEEQYPAAVARLGMVDPELEKGV